MSALSEVVGKDDRLIGYMFNCPGCKVSHVVHVTEKNSLGAQWTFNGDLEKPTFSPSLLQKISWTVPVNGKTQDVCHLFVRDGMCEFLNDCTHELAGKTVPLVKGE